MADDTRISTAARYLFDGAVAGEKLAGLPQEMEPADLSEAYLVQDELQALWQAAGSGPIVGWKVALTSKVMQELVGVGEPCAGAIFASRLHRSPAAVSSADFVNLGVESEIAVRLANDLPADGGPYDRQTVADAVGAVMAGIELVDDRSMDYSRITAGLLVADNAWNAGCVLGEEIADWRTMDLATLTGRMTINDETVGSGVGGDALGHPFEPLAWLANNLNRRGRMLRAGDVVMTGSIVATKWLNAGDRMTTDIDRLGDARLDVR